MLRSSLQLSRESWVKLSEEIEALENYLSLQKMRYDDAFNYQINIDEVHETESMLVPPMLMQPFVENAILHGINPNGKNGLITINFDIENEILVVNIKDNGNGKSTVVKSSTHQSLLTRISKERLSYIAKESGLNAGIDIKNDEKLGTVVTITIPIKSGECKNKKRLYSIK
ncbi:sensor histidine kinase [Pedobacter sp.]|uniref:sensor histidine kinase n=1 Tax=Pedobacter sp. TaxID=1411316 RepID=UPI003BABB64E